MIEYKTQEMQMIPYKDRRKIEKKVLPEYYKGIRTHKKMFELRKDEDGIKPGDILVLREWDGEKYTGGMTRREVTAILKDCPEYGLMDGYCILSLQTPGWDFVTPSAQPKRYWMDSEGNISALPSAQPERKRVEWINDTRYSGWTCTHCNYHDGNRTDNFCPNCGAGMKGAEQPDVTDTNVGDMIPRQWVPCSERLPNGQTEVIVSCCDDAGDSKYNYTSCGWMTRDGEYWIVDNEINYYVIAWMPLPKPYCG